jgi:hypothetical protein
MKCKRANAEYTRKRRNTISDGPTDPLVDASTTQEYLQYLSEAGIGSRAVHESTDVARHILVEIATGRRRRIRRSTQQRILNVTAEAVADGARVNPELAQMQIEELMQDGDFTAAELSRRLGISEKLYPMKSRKMRASTVARINRFYRLIMAEAGDDYVEYDAA